MSRSKKVVTTARWTQTEIDEAHRRAFEFEQQQSKERAPVRFMFVGAAVCIIALGFFSELFFPASKDEVTRVLLWGLLGLGVGAYLFYRQGERALKRETQRIIEEIGMRRQE